MVRRESFFTRFLRWLKHRYTSQGVTLKPGILTQTAPNWQNQTGFIGDFLVMFGSWVGRSEQQDLGLPIDQYIVLDAVSFFLATIVLSLFFRVFGALNRSFGTILKEKLSFCGSKLQFRDAAPRRCVLVSRPILPRLGSNKDAEYESTCSLPTETC